KPISLFRTRARASSDIFDTSWPFSQYSPAFGVSRQPMMFISVDLPEPDGPMMATYSLRAMATSTPRSARTISPPMSYSRLMPCVTITHFESGGAPDSPTAAWRAALERDCVSMMFTLFGSNRLLRLHLQLTDECAVLELT